MDIKEFYSVSSSTVQSKNAVSWSEDHKACVLSSSSLHIYEVAPNPNATSTEVCLKKSIIQPLNDTPTANAGIDTTWLLCNLEQRDAYHLILDTKLTPHLPDVKLAEPHFTSAGWSPAGLFQDHRCMLATLTSFGCLKIYVPYLNSWIEIFDFCEFWTKYCKMQWLEEKKEMVAGELFEQLKTRTSRLKITGLIWGHLIKTDKKRYTYLATISHGGTLTLWKVDHLADLGSPVHNFNPKIMTTCETLLYNSSTLHWMVWESEISIIVGDANGQVKIFSFVINETDDTVQLTSVNYIWKEKDNMQVSCIKSLPHKNFKILGVAKNSFFLAFLVSQTQVISFCHDHIGGLPITGMEVQSSEVFVVCTLAGILCKYAVNLKESEEKHELTISSLILKSNLSWQDAACYGIAKKCNSDMWLLCTNLCKSYDHLVMRRPSQIVFFTLNDSNKENLLLTEFLKNASKLRFHWEDLEIFRIHYLRHLKIQVPKDIEMQQNLEDMTNAQLQMELWRIRILVNYLVITDVIVRNPDACAYVSLLEEIILCRHACKYIYSLNERHKRQPLTEKNLVSFGLLRLWLLKWLSHNKTNSGTDKNSEPKDTEMSIISNSEEKELTKDVEIDKGSAHVGMSNFISSVDITENAGDGDSVSLGSFDDAISTDSNSSSVVSDKKAVSKKLQIHHGRVPSSFLKVKLPSTVAEVIKVLALPIITGTPEKELCVFCTQEVQMDIDWRFGTCPANHKMSRCCQCMRQCYEVPLRQCVVCPTVACVDIDEDLNPFCTFCDAPLIVDEKFKKPGVSLPQQGKIV